MPSTLEIPLVEPITALLGSSTPQFVENAHRVFGGPGIPTSTATISRPGGADKQTPIPLTTFSEHLKPSETELFMGVLWPGIYASAMSTLVETRKRLGTQWAEDCVRKAQTGDLKILDAGGAGAAVVAVREMLRAEWQRMHEEQDMASTATSLAPADGRAGGAGAFPPLGQATVLATSDTLRHAASSLLENTTFIPRLPDYIHSTSGHETSTKGKFDIVIASHTIWPIREDFHRKQHVSNLWSLLKNDGGVLIMLEKGVARGFEAIAGARDMLLKDGMLSDQSSTSSDFKQKEKSMIIAPCTNHVGCPLFSQKGHVRGRKEICAFPQRFHRPPFLQRIYDAQVRGAKASGKNFDDVEFSYLSVWRGKDLRSETDMEGTVMKASADFVLENISSNHGRGSTYAISPPSAQDENATLSALRGYPHPSWPGDGDSLPLPHSLNLPRLIFPPLKRTGHVILDLCTPSGTAERWTVPKSHGKQSFRDARKASWGDLWGLGAKSRVGRNLKADKDLRREANEKAKAAKASKAGSQADAEAQMMDEGENEDESKGSVLGRAQKREEQRQARKQALRETGFEDEGGRKGQVRKGWIKGIREKRDKKGRGADDGAQSGGKKKRRAEQDDDDE